MKKKCIFIMAIVFLASITTLSYGRDYLVLHSIRNDTDKDLTIQVSNGGSQIETAQVKAHAAVLTDDYLLDTGMQEYIMIEGNTTSQVGFSTKWFNSLAPYYTILESTGYTSPNIGGWLIRSVAYAELIVSPKDGDGTYKYTWQGSN